MMKTAIVLVGFALASTTTWAQSATSRQEPTISGSNSAAGAPTAEAPIKKSRTGICHAPGTTFYARTKNFTPFATMDECMKSGGRLPKR